MKFVYMRTTFSVPLLNMGLKLELNLLRQLVFILLCLHLLCAEYEFKTFGAARDEFRQVMKLVYLQTTCRLTVPIMSYNRCL